MCVLKPTSGERRSAHSPSPVSVGVNTRCPADSRRGVSFFQHHAPCHAPWTSTYVLMCDLDHAALWWRHHGLGGLRARSRGALGATPSAGRLKTLQPVNAEGSSVIRHGLR